MLPRCCKYGEELKISETRLADGLAPRRLLRGVPNSLYHDSIGWRAQDFVTILSQVAPASISMNDMA